MMDNTKKEYIFYNRNTCLIHRICHVKDGTHGTTNGLWIYSKRLISLFFWITLVHAHDSIL